MIEAIVGFFLETAETVLEYCIAKGGRRVRSKLSARRKKRKIGSKNRK